MGNIVYGNKLISNWRWCCEATSELLCRSQGLSQVMSRFQEPCNTPTALNRGVIVTTSREVDLTFGIVDSNVDPACTPLLSPLSPLPPPFASPPPSAAAGEPILDPGVFTIIFIFFPYWWLPRSYNKLFSLCHWHTVQITVDSDLDGNSDSAHKAPCVSGLLCLPAATPKPTTLSPRLLCCCLSACLLLQTCTYYARLIPLWRSRQRPDRVCALSRCPSLTRFLPCVLSVWVALFFCLCVHHLFISSA